MKPDEIKRELKLLQASKGHELTFLVEDIQNKLKINTIYPCYPIKLNDELLTVLDHADTLTVTLNDNPITQVNIKQHPDSILWGTHFVPFFADMPFDFATAGLQYTEMKIIAQTWSHSSFEDGQTLYTQNIRREFFDYHSYNNLWWLIRTWDNNYFQLQIRDGYAHIPNLD